MSSEKHCLSGTYGSSHQKQISATHTSLKLMDLEQLSQGDNAKHDYKTDKKEKCSRVILITNLTQGYLNGFVSS